jgi:hypothetical protein
LLEHEHVQHHGIAFWIMFDIAAGFMVAPLHEIGACLGRAPITGPIIILTRIYLIAQDENNPTENRPGGTFQGGDNF